MLKSLFYSFGDRQPSTVNRQPSTVNRQPSTVNRQHEINLFFAKFLYKLVQLFFNSFEYSQSLRAERSEAWQSRFKKINFKNLVSLINEFYQKWIASAK